MSSAIDLSQRINKLDYDLRSQINIKCPICMIYFKEDDRVAVHQDCEFGVHWHCFERWMSEGRKNCTACYARIKRGIE